jgi:hypothetical protein
VSTGAHPPEASAPCAAVSAQTFVEGTGVVRRCAVTGCNGVPETFAANLTNPVAIAVGANAVFWVEAGNGADTGRIWAAAKEGRTRLNGLRPVGNEGDVSAETLLRSVVFGTLRAAAFIAPAVAFPAKAVASPVTAVPAGGEAVTLVVDVPSVSSLQPERLRAALARELGVPVVWDRDAPGGTLVVRQEGARAMVSFDRPDGRHDGRAIALDADPVQAEHAVVLLAENVARDQTAQFEALPSAPPPSPPTPPPATPAPLPAPLPAAGPPAPRPAPHLVSPCDPPRPWLPAAIDFLPGVGMSTIDGGRAVRRISVGALGALSGGVRGAAISGIADVDRGPVCGFQLAGIVNVATAVAGAQTAGVTNVAERFAGAQIAGIANVAAGDSRGAQVGLVNVDGGRLAGVQIGLVNYAEHADFQLGLVNVVRDGRFRVDAWTKPEMGLLLAGVKHGGAHYHWTYAVGVRPADPSRPWVAIGGGAHVTPAPGVFVDIDVTDHAELLFVRDRDAQVAEARATVGASLFPALALFAGPTLNVGVQGASARSGAPGYARTLTSGGSPQVLLWPGLVVGVEGL